MNRIYKVIWSKVRCSWVVVSEIARNHGKEHSSRKNIPGGVYILGLALALGLALPSGALAADPVNLGNNASAAYDDKGNLTIGNTGTVAEGANKAGKNNTTIGTDTDTLRNVTEGETSKNGQPMDETNDILVKGEGQANDLAISTEADGSTAVGYQSRAEGERSTAIGNNAKITDKPVVYYADAEGKKTTSQEDAAWYKDKDGKPTQVPQVFRDADGNTTTTPQYIHTYTEKDPATGKETTKTEITSDASKADQKDGKPVYNYQKSDNLDKLYSVTLYQASNDSIAAGSNVSANGSKAVAVGYSSSADSSAVAIGDMATAAENAIAIGKETEATENAVAIGKNTQASAEGSIALGKDSQAIRSGGITGWDPKTGTTSTKSGTAWVSGAGALSIGNGGASRQITNVAAGSEDSDAVNLAQLKNAMTHYYSVKTTADTDAAGKNNYLNDGATGNNALAAGVGATASSDDATAVGTYANATASQATAIGRSASASSYQDTAIGYNAGAHGTYATAVGSSASATSFQSTAIGYNAGAHGSYATALGNSANASSTNATALGASANASYENSTAVGASAKATNNQATAIGSSAEATATYATALGNGASATNTYAVAIGADANAPSYQATALGNGASATSSQATAIGTGAGARGSYATALGNGASAYSSYATALGSGATAQSSDDTAIGSSAKASNGDATALGYNAQATAPNATALGSGASAYYHAIAIGAASASSSYALAAGDGANAQEYQAIALGYNAKSNVTGGAALGSGSTAYRESGQAGLDTVSGALSSSTDPAWKSTYGAISVGNFTRSDDGKTVTVNGTRQIVGVAAGSEDTDAVNVAQLKAALRQTGTGTIHDYSVNSADTTTDTNYNNGGAQGSNALAAGVSAKAIGDSSVAIGNGAQAEGKGATVIGKNAKATGQYATAFGGLETTDKKTGKTVNVINTASGASSTAFGQGTQARGNASLAFGLNTIAGGADGSGQQSVAFGEDTQALGGRSLAFGEKTIAKYNDSVAFGNDTRASSTGATAFGNRTRALSSYSTAWGNATVAADEESTAWGTDTIAGAKLDANGAVTNIYTYKNNPDDKNEQAKTATEQMDVHGNLAYIQPNGKTAGIKQMKIDSGGELHDYVVLAGKDGNTYVRDYQGSLWKVNVAADGTVTVDTTAGKNKNGKVYNGKNGAKQSLATTTVKGAEVAITPDNVLTKAHEGSNGYSIEGYANATAFGYSTEASGDNATAFGNDTKAAGAGATAFGYKTLASGENATAFGESSIAAGKNSLAALGGTTTDDATNAAAIGNGAKANLADSMALGSGAVADRASGAKGYDMLTKGDTTNTSIAWVSNANAIAVGNGSTLTRQITGVAAGSQDTDAVNVAQLKAAGFKVTTQNDGSISSSILNGDTLDFEGKDNAIVSTSKDSKTITVAVSKTPTFDSATFYNPNPSEGQNNEKVTISNGHISTYNKNQQERAVLGTDNQGSGTLHLINNDLSQVHVYTQNSKEDGNDGITRMYYISSSGDGGEIQGIHTIAVLDDGINYAGDNVKPNTSDKVVVKHKLNSTMDITGGADTNNLAGGNIGVVATPAVEDDQGNITQKAKLELKLNKDLTGLNTVTAGNAKIGSASADALKLTENGAVTEKTAPAGSYVTGLDNKYWNTTNPSYVSGRAATEDQLAAVSGTINQGLGFTTNTKDAANTTDNYKGYKVVNRKLGDTISIKAGDADPDMKYVTTNLTSQIAENGDITISMAESPTFNIVTATSVNLSPKDITTKDQAGYTASARLDAHYRDASLNPEKNVTMADGSTGMVRLHYHDGENTIHDLATMDDGQIYAGDIKTDGTADTTGFNRRINEKTTINGGVTDKDNLTDNNIGVVSNGTNTLTVKLAKDLKGLNSVTTGKTIQNDSGITITNDIHNPNKTVAVKGDEVTFGGNQVTNMGSGADGTADGKPDGTPTYNTLTNGANIGDVKNIAGSTTDAAKLTGDSNITVIYNDSTADGKNTVKLNDSITLGSDADKKVTIDGTAGTITAGGKVSLDGSTGTGSIGGVTIGNQTGVTTTKMDGDKAKTEDGTFVTGLSNKTWNPDSNGIVSGRAATEDQLKTVSDTVNAGWELDVNGTKQKTVTPTSPKVNFVQGQNISISGSGDDVTVATADDVRFTTIHVTGDKNDSGSYTDGITIGKQSGGDSANPGPGYYITGLENKSWNKDLIQSGRAATEDQLKQVAEDIKHGTVDGDKYVTGGTATYGNDGKGSAKLTGTNGLEGTIDNLHDYYVTKGEVSDDGKTLKMTKNDGTTFDVSLGKIMQSDMRLVQNPAREDGKYIVDSDGNLTLTVQDANGTEATKQTITLSGLSSKAEVDKGLTFAANSGTPYNAKLGNTVTVKGSAVKAGHDYSDENLTTEVDGNGNITIQMDKDLTANTMTVSGKDGKDGQIGITGKDGADGTVTTIIKTIGKNGTNGTDGTPGVNGTDGITRIVYQDGKDGEAGMTTHTVATLDDGLKFGANAPVVGKTVNPVGNKMNSTINIKGAGTKELQDYSGKNLLTSVEQAADGTTTIHVLMDRNISADGVTVGQAGTDGVAGENGEVGQAGTIGINGKNGVQGDGGKEIITTTIIRTEKGQPGENGATGKPGVDGKDITRIVYQNDQDQVDGKDGTHTVATLDDGLKFSGDDNKVITKKLNENLQFVGGADKAKLTQNNIGINELEDGKLTIQLVNTPDLGTKGNLKAGDAHIGWFDGDALNMTRDGTNPSGNKAGAGSYATGLSNKDWNVADPEYVSGRAATEDQLAKVSEAINNAVTAAGKRTVVTVNDKSHPAAATPNATAGAYGDYDSTGGNLMIAAKKDDEGQMTYNIKLNDQLAIGKKGTPGQNGKDGTDGKVTVETSKGTTVVIGHDGEPGKDGKDGISVKGQDGKDGVTLSVTNGKDGKDGSEGHIGLTGPKGKDGKDASADIHVKNGQNGVDGTDGNKGKDGMDRIVYEDHNGKTHEVATMDDGLKFMGNDGQEVSRKLNEILSIKGGLDKDAVATASSKNLGVRKSDNGLEIVMTDTPDFTKVTVGGDKKITIGGQTNSDTKNPINGNYITGLDNKAWDKDNVVADRAATEGQLKEAINEISGKDKGGFGLAAEKGGSVQQDLGGTITVKGDTIYKEDGTTVDKEGNIKTSVDNGAIKVELNKDVDLGQNGSVKAGNTTINKDGVDTNKVKVGGITITDQGIDGGAKQITNIASGIDGKKYATAGDNNAASIGDVKQLARNEAKASEAKSGKNITVKDDHTVNLNDDVTLGNDPNKQVAINGSKGQVVIGSGDKAMTLGKQENKAGDSNPKEGNFLNGLDNKKWDGEHIQTGRAATEDQLKTVSDKVNSGRKFQGDDGQEVKVGMGETLHLKGGATEISDANNIGIVKGDDNTLNIRLAKELTGLNSVTTGNTTINNGGLTVNTGDANRTITVQDGNVNMGGNQIHNVAPGTAPTDAVNVSQLQQTGRAINQLGSSLDKLGTRVDRVGANSAALAALHPLDFDPDDKLDFAVGAGNYSGANAVALGAFYRPNEDVMFSLGGSTGGGENMVNLGATFKLGQHNHVSNSRVAMAKEIRDLKALVARQDGEMQQLKTLMNQLAGKPVMRVDKDALFPDIPENHWAYEYVIKLARAGIIEGYEDGQFKGDRMMTRYEFAALLYRAIMAGAAANPDLNQDGTLGKLVKEFDGELKYIRIDVIEKDKHGKPTIERVRTVEDSEKHHGK